MNLTHQTAPPETSTGSASTPLTARSRWSTISRNHACDTAPMDATSCTVTVGYARVAAGSTLRDTHEHLSVVLIVDNDTHRILEVDSTAVTGVVHRWLSSLLTGQDITAPLTNALHVIDTNYLGAAAGAIRQALLDAARRYAAHLTESSEP